MAPRRRITREELRRYVRESPFTRGEILRLWARFNKLDVDGSGSLAIDEMLQVDELRCNPFAPRIVILFSEDGSGVINFQKFINMFSVFSSRASPETKTVWAFALWDFDGDDLIGNRDIKRGLHMLTNANIDILDADDNDDLDAVEKKRQRETHRRQSRDDELLSSDHMNQILDRIAEEIDPAGTGVSFNDFESIAGRMPDFISNFKMSV